MRHTPSLTVLTLLCITVAGCSSNTYIRRPAALEGREVRVEATLKDQLFTETTAYRYTVNKVVLILADGTTVEPTFSAQTYESNYGGGPRTGVGVGVFGGSGGGGGGVGVGTAVGGDRVVTSVTYEARWSDPPTDQQPFTLRATLETEPPVHVNIPLGTITKTEPAPADSGADRLEMWKLVDGTTATFLVTDSSDADMPPTYKPAE